MTLTVIQIVNTDTNPVLKIVTVQHRLHLRPQNVLTYHGLVVLEDTAGEIRRYCCAYYY
jgi:hypothetical protein